MKPSLSSVTELFREMGLRQGFKKMFRGGYLLRELVSSGINIKSKHEYLVYVSCLRRGFLRGRLDYLN